MKSDMSSTTLLRNVGLRATPGRIALLNALMAESRPLTVEELHAKVPQTDLVTVYRTAQSFVERNLVQEVQLKKEPVRYEFFSGMHHHHLICTGCGTIDELPECDLGKIEQAVLRKSSFASVNDHSLDFFGFCRACANK